MNGSQRRPRVVLAKTSLDGHWRGVMVVATTLRDAGFEVISLGMVTAESIVAATVDEDADLVGLNIGGRLEVVERVLDGIEAARPGTPVIAGGTIAPWAVRRLEARGVAVFPPGSPLQAIAAKARELTGQAITPMEPPPAR